MKKNALPYRIISITKDYGIDPVGKGKYKLKDPVFVVMEYKGKVAEFIIPEGFVFDGASVPRLFWSLIGITPIDTGIIDAAVVHDYLYSKKGMFYAHVKNKQEMILIELSRKDCDFIFKMIIIRTNELNKVQIFIAYRGVRMGGYFSWKR